MNHGGSPWKCRYCYIQNPASLRATEMKKFIKLLIIFAAFLLLGLGFWQLYIKKAPANVPNEKAVQTYSAGLTINSTQGTENFDISDFIDKTALEATQANAKVVTTGSSTNAFVTSINGVSADSQKHEFWEFDVNGNQAQVGAGSYTVRNGDQILWKISTY